MSAGPVHIETIGGFQREIAFPGPEFIQLWPQRSAAELAGFIRMARKGKPLEPGKGAFATEAEFQKAQLEQSLVHCKQSPGLGLKD